MYFTFYLCNCIVYMYFHFTFLLEGSEPVFLNVYGAQESIPRNYFRQPM